MLSRKKKLKREPSVANNFLFRNAFDREPIFSKLRNLLLLFNETHVATVNLIESHLWENYGTYLVASTRSMLLQKNSKREPSVGKLWNLLGRLHEIHVASKKSKREPSVAKL